MRVPNEFHSVSLPLWNRVYVDPMRESECRRRVSGRFAVATLNLIPKKLANATRLTSCALQQSSDGIQQIASGPSLGEVPIRSHTDGFIRKLGRIMHRQHQNLGRRSTLADLPSSLQAVKDRHRNIQNNEI